jgi:hypothetical protein
MLINEFFVLWDSILAVRMLIAMDMSSQDPIPIGCVLIALRTYE